MRGTTTLLTSALLACALGAGGAQAGQWAKAYGKTGNDTGGIEPIPGGGYYIEGHSNSYAGGMNALIARLSPTGRVTWAKTIGGGKEDLLDVVPVADGYLVHGESKSFSAAGDTDLVWAKFDANWQPVYQKGLGGAREEAGQFLDTGDGGLLFSGTSNSYGMASGDADILLLKTAADGSVTWKKVLHLGNGDFAGHAIEVSDGFLVAGQTLDAMMPFPSALLLKLNKSNGDILWKKQFTLPFTKGMLTGSWQLHPLANGDVAAVGSYMNMSTSEILAIVLRLAADGSLAWQKAYALPGYSMTPMELLENADGSLVLTGAALSSSTTLGSIFAIKLKPTGAQTWAKLYGDGAHNFGHIGRTASGELFISGHHAASLDDPDQDMLYGKLNATFTPVWTKTLGGAGLEVGWHMKQGASYLAGGITNSYGQGVPLKSNIFGIKLDGQGDYPACIVQSITLTVDTTILTVSSPGLTAGNPSFTSRMAGNPADISLTVNGVALPATDICAPIRSGEE